MRPKYSSQSYIYSVSKFLIYLVKPIFPILLRYTNELWTWALSKYKTPKVEQNDFENIKSKDGSAETIETSDSKLLLNILEKKDSQHNTQDQNIHPDENEYVTVLHEDAPQYLGENIPN